jgi:hypothetical protein
MKVLLLLLATMFSLTVFANEAYPERDLFIQMNYYDNSSRFIKLNDGSYWTLNYTYSRTTDMIKGKDRESLWLYPDRIEIKRSDSHRFPYLLCNIDKNEAVEAAQVDPLLRIGSILKSLYNTSYNSNNK